LQVTLLIEVLQVTLLIEVYIDSSVVQQLAQTRGRGGAASAEEPKPSFTSAVSVARAARQPRVIGCIFAVISCFHRSKLAAQTIASILEAGSEGNFLGTFVST